MALPTAYADSSDPSQANMVAVLITAGLVAGVCLLAFAVVFTARVRGHRQGEAIMVVVIFWGLASIGALVYSTVTQMNWTKEQELRLETGYGNPQDLINRAAVPWEAWVGLMVAYAAILSWSLLRTKPPTE